MITDLMFVLSEQIREECHFCWIVFQRTNAISYWGRSLLIKVGQICMCIKRVGCLKQLSVFYRVSSIKLPYLMHINTLVCICRISVWYGNLMCCSRCRLFLHSKKLTMLWFSNNLLYLFPQLGVLKEKLPRSDEHFILFGPVTKLRIGQTL